MDLPAYFSYIFIALPFAVFFLVMFAIKKDKECGHCGQHWWCKLKDGGGD